MDRPREKAVYLDEKQNPISFPVCFSMRVCKDVYVCVCDKSV